MACFPPGFQQYSFLFLRGRNTVADCTGVPSTKAIVAAEEAFKKGEVMMSPNIKRLSEYSILFACFLCYCLIVLNISKMLHSGSLLFFSVCIVLTVF